MKQLVRRIAKNDHGVAALEFAIFAPVLLLMLGGGADFTLAFLSKSLLASSVAQGAQYAFLRGRGVSTTAIQSIVARKLSLPAATVAVAGPSCFCISSTPAAAVSQTCGTACQDLTMPGTYMTISAHYTYTSFLPLYSRLANPVLVESTTVRLK